MGMVGAVARWVLAPGGSSVWILVKGAATFAGIVVLTTVLVLVGIMAFAVRRVGVTLAVGSGRRLGGSGSRSARLICSRSRVAFIVLVSLIRVPVKGALVPASIVIAASVLILVGVVAS